MSKSEEPSVVALDRPQAQTASNRPELDVAPRLERQRPVRPVEIREARLAIDGAVALQPAPLGREEVVHQVATVAGYALGGAVLFQLGAWVLAGL